MLFKIYCTKPEYGSSGEYVGVKEKYYFYNNMTSEVFNDKGKLVNIAPINPNDRFNNVYDSATSLLTPKTKSNKINTLKIQLGLSCNYSCEYCSQRFVPNIDYANSKYVNKFLADLDSWISEPPKKIEFWGGEPFVYWKTLKPLAERLREKYPTTSFSTITNGSLITEEIIEWLYNMGFSLAVSHDGPGQNVRGPDPFDDPVQRKILFKLFNKFLPEGRISINSMIHRENMDREKIQLFFEDLFNLSPESRFGIGEGGFIDVYDEGGRKNVPQNLEEHVAHRRTTLKLLRENTLNRFIIVRDRLQSWVDSWGNYRPATSIGQKCGMDNENNIAVDLQGNVVTCQNVTATSNAPNGQSHKIGHVSRFNNIKLDTATHWRFREECSKCPVLQVCQGSCMFLQGEYFKLSCDAAYSDHIPFFAIAFEHATNGYLPYKVEAIEEEYSLPPDREDMWGTISSITPVTVEVRELAVDSNFKM